MTNYEERFSRWFATFAAQLESPSASKTNRLAELHRAIVRLLRQLDVEQLLLQFDENKRLLKP